MKLISQIRKLYRLSCEKKYIQMEKKYEKNEYKYGAIKDFFKPSP